jgi:hypothetical protein
MSNPHVRKPVKALLKPELMKIAAGSDDYGKAARVELDRRKSLKDKRVSARRALLVAEKTT